MSVKSVDQFMGMFDDMAGLSNETIARESFAQFYARKHGLPVGRWEIEGERHNDTLRRFMDTMAEFADALHGRR